MRGAGTDGSALLGVWEGKHLGYMRGAGGDWERPVGRVGGEAPWLLGAGTDGSALLSVWEGKHLGYMRGAGGDGSALLGVWEGKHLGFWVLVGM